MAIVTRSQLTVKKFRRYAPELNFIKATYPPQLDEFLRRLLEQLAITQDVVEEVTGLGETATGDSGLVEWFLENISKGLSNTPNFVAGSGITISMQRDPVSGLMDITVATTAGTGFPFSVLFEWNRADTTQFDSLIVTGNPTQNTVLSVVTSQASSAIRTSPYLSLQHNTSSPPLQVGNSWLYTTASPSGGGTNGTLLIMDFAESSGATMDVGIVFGKPGSESSDYYLLSLGSGGVGTTARLDKFISGTRHEQGAQSAIGSFGASNGASYKTVYWLVRPDGRSVIRMPGTSPDLIFDAPMTLGNATVWGVGKFGIKAQHDAAGNSSFIGFSRMAVLSVPLTGEPALM